MVPKLRNEADFDWDVTQFPKGTNGSIVQLDASGWAIAKSSKHKEEAQKLVNYLASSKNSEKFATSGLIVPARKDASRSKYFLDGQKPVHSKIFLDIIETSKPTPVTVDYREITDKLKNQWKQSSTNVPTYFITKKTEKILSLFYYMFILKTMLQQELL